MVGAYTESSEKGDCAKRHLRLKKNQHYILDTRQQEPVPKKITFLTKERKK